MRIAACDAEDLPRCDQYLMLFGAMEQLKGIHLFRQAESILGAGHADIVALARQALADPDWFEKVRTGHGAEVRRCHYTNYCEALDQQHREVTCQLWDKPDPDDPSPRSRDGRRRLIPPPWRPEVADRQPVADPNPASDADPPRE